MKQSTRVASVLLAVVMLLSAIPLSVYAAYTPYTSPSSYDANDKPVISPAQAASMVLDMVDAMLAENDMTVPVDVSILGSKTIDLRSIDKAITSITDFWNWGLLNTAFDILSFGDIEDMNMTWIKQCPLRTSSGQTDLDVLLGLCRFLKDNHVRVGKIIDDSFNYGFVETVTDLPAEVHDIPGTIKAGILKSLNDDVEPPAGTTVDSFVQKIVSDLVVGVYNPDTDKYEDGLLPSMLGKFNINTTSVYTFMTDAINAAISDVIVPLLSKLVLELAGVEFSEEFPGGDDSHVGDLGMIITMLTENAAIVYEPEDLLTPLSRMTCALKYYLMGEGLQSYIWLDDTGLHVSDQLVQSVDSLVRLALSLLPGFGFLEATKVFKTEEEINAMTLGECYAYLGRLLINEFVEYAQIPETCNSLRSVLTYLLIGIAADVLPDVDYDNMITLGTLNPDTDGLFIVGADLIRYYLNGLTSMNIPTGLNFEQTIDFMFTWAMTTYGGFFNTSDFKASDTVWQKIDKVLFDIIPLNWLPAEFTGSQYLLMDWLIGNILDFDYVGLLSIVKRNPSSELNTNIVKVVLNTAARLINGMFGDRTVMPTTLTTIDSLFTKPNFRALVQQLCLYLADYGNSIMGTLFPIVTKFMGIWTNETYLRKAPAGSPLVSIIQLRNLVESYTPKNTVEYYQPGYFTFGEEDFTELNKYFSFRTERLNALALIEAYEEDPTTLDLTKNTDCAYRLTYYHNRLTLKGTVCATQLTKTISKAYYSGFEQSNYTAESWAAYQQAYNFAMEVRSEAILSTNGSVKQSKVNEARHKLLTAIRNLADFVPFADYTQLDFYIQTANERMATLNFDLYTPESVQAFTDALNAANIIDRLISYENQDQVDTVAANLYAAMYGLVFLLPPGIVPIPDSTQDFYGNPITPVVDTTRKYVYGLSTGGLVGDIYNAVGGADVAVSPTSFGSGTGTKIRVIFEGMVVATYTVVVFGDINGDGNIDDGDSGLIIDNSNYYSNWNSKPEKKFAADLNGDGRIDGIDADIVSLCLNWIMGIDQTTGQSFEI